MTEYERKFDAAMAELKATGIWRSNYAPPLTKVQRKLGWMMRPPHYASFWRIVIGYALWFGPVWGLMMWLVTWQRDGTGIGGAIGYAAFAGVMFGVLMAAYYLWSRRKHGLSDWAEL